MNALSVLLIVSMLAVLAVLVTGVISFAVHGRFYQKNSNRLMRLRVVCQGAAVLFLAAAAFLAAAG